VGVTAATGIASINIGGCTLHSWAGIGLGKGDPVAEDRNNLPVDENNFTTDRWKQARALIVDESTSSLDVYNRYAYIR
ncbi:uncharacterized protein B0H18DRAFT_882181, partial [Fomitopsis serialis]|uniref:uncharacterized protein n=1 Tax=Fomitopsis serialis TaxID=139415 RepID=UPI00200779AF